MSQAPGSAISPPLFCIVNGVTFYSVDGGTTWTASLAARPGVSPGNASATVNPASDAASVYTIDPGTLTTARVLTLGTGGSPVTNSVVQVIRRDLSANTYTVKDDAGTTLLVFAASPATAQGASFYYTGAHYALLSFYYVA